MVTLSVSGIAIVEVDAPTGAIVSTDAALAIALLVAKSARKRARKFRRRELLEACASDAHSLSELQRGTRRFRALAQRVWRNGLFRSGTPSIGAGNAAGESGGGASRPVRRRGAMAPLLPISIRKCGNRGFSGA